MQLLAGIARSRTCLATFLRPPGGGSPTLAQPGREEGSSAATPGVGFPGDDAGWPFSAQTMWFCAWGTSCLDEVARRPGLASRARLAGTWEFTKWD